jgi:hypothetical protein
VTADWLTPRTWLISFGVALATVVFASIMVSRSYIADNALNLNESDRISDCTSELLGSLKPQAAVVDLGMIEHVRFVCYQEVFNEDKLTDWGIRKSAYLNQQVQTPVMLWMVVAITLSGVFLAALQLLAAYRLAALGKAAFEQGGQLSVEHNKISLSSSVTGLMVLAVSFAFFLVFVTKVYLIQESKGSETALSGSAVGANQIQSSNNIQGSGGSVQPCLPVAIASPNGMRSSPPPKATPTGSRKTTYVTPASHSPGAKTPSSSDTPK